MGGEPGGAAQRGKSCKKKGVDMVSNAAATQGRMKNGKRSLDLELGGVGRSWSLSSLHWGNTGALGWLRPTSRLPPPPASGAAAAPPFRPLTFV